MCTFFQAIFSSRPTFSKSVDLEALLHPIGFEIEFFGHGYMKLESEELAIEFLAPEIGRPRDTPLPLPAIKLNAQPLRHLQMLWRQPIALTVSGIRIHLPHPADYALQKLIIAEKRKNPDKAAKDRQGAFVVLDALIENGELSELHNAVENLSRETLKTVVTEFAKSGRQNILV